MMGGSLREHDVIDDGFLQGRRDQALTNRIAAEFMQ